MCTDPSAAVIADQLDNRQIFWRNLTRSQRRAVMRHVIADMRDNGVILGSAAYDENRPPWAPQSQWLSRSTGLSLKALAGVNSSRVCECGQPARHAVPIVVLSGEGNACTGMLHLCDACHVDHTAMERIYG